MLNLVKNKKQQLQLSKSPQKKLFVQKKILTEEDILFEREIHQFNEAMGDMITNMSHFDENMKLKLQLNLNLIEQDYIVWNQHDQEAEGDQNLQEVINSLKKIINLQMGQ